MIASFAAALSFVALHQDLRASADWVAMSLPNVATKLGNLYHTSIFVSPNCREATLLLRFTDAPFGEVQQQIGKVVGASWSRTSNGWQLARTPAQSRKEQELERTAKLYAAQKMIQNARERIGKLAEFTSSKANALAEAVSRQMADPNRQFQSVPAYELSGPTARFEANIIASLTPEVLADIPDNEIVVYSNRPTPMQRRIPFPVEPFLATFESDQQRYVDAASRYLQSQEIFSGQGIGHTYLKPIQVANGTTLIKFQKMSMGVIGKVTAYDAAGVKVVERNIFLPLGATSLASLTLNSFDSTEGARRLENDAKVAAEDLRPLSREFEQLRDNRDRSYSKEFVEAFLNPEKQDPLSFSVSDIVRKRSPEKFICALLPDAWGRSTPGLVAESIEALAMPESQKISGGWVESESGWWRFRAASPIAISREYFDRKTLGQIVRKVNSKRELTLDEQAQIALASGRKNLDRNSLSLVYNRSLRPTVTQPQNRIWLRIWATISDSQRENMRNTEQWDALAGQDIEDVIAKLRSVPLSRLNPVTSEVIADAVYNSFTSHELRKAFSAKEKQEERMAFDFGIWREPTILLPNGIPRTSTVSIVQNSDEVIVGEGEPDESGARGRTRPMNPYELAYQLADQNLMPARPGSRQAAGRVDSNRLRLATRTYYQVRVQLTPIHSFSGTLMDLTEVSKDIYSLQTLPERIRKPLLEQITQITRFNQQNQNRGNSTDSGTRPPPPFRSN